MKKRLAGPDVSFNITKTYCSYSHFCRSSVALRFVELCGGLAEYARPPIIGVLKLAAKGNAVDVLLLEVLTTLKLRLSGCSVFSLTATRLKLYSFFIAAMLLVVAQYCPPYSSVICCEEKVGIIELGTAYLSICVFAGETTYFAWLTLTLAAMSRSIKKIDWKVFKNFTSR